MKVVITLICGVGIVYGFLRMLYGFNKLRLTMFGFHYGMVHEDFAKKGVKHLFVGLLILAVSFGILFLVAKADGSSQDNGKSNVENIDKWHVGIPAYVICDIATQSEQEANNRVRELKDKGYQSGYLWIPDYKSLSGRPYFEVYVGPFNTKEKCKTALEDYRKIRKDAYGLLVSQNPERIEVR